MSKEQCRVCHGFGEVDYLESPGSAAYRSEACPACVGTGWTHDRQAAANINAEAALEAAVAAIERALRPKVKPRNAMTCKRPGCTEIVHHEGENCPECNAAQAETLGDR